MWVGQLKVKIDAENMGIGVFDPETGRHIRTSLLKVPSVVELHEVVSNLWYNTSGNMVNIMDDPFSFSYPDLADIGIMGRCEHNDCKFCYAKNNYGKNMSVEDYKVLMDLLGEHLNEVALGGYGDPNKHMFFQDILSTTRLNGVVPNYTTSGNGITDREVSLTKEYCGAVAVSMHKQDYTWAAIRSFQESKTLTNIHLIVMKSNMSSILDIMEGRCPNGWSVDFDAINAVILLSLKPIGMASSMMEESPTQADFCRLIEAMDKGKALCQIGVDPCWADQLFRHSKLSNLPVNMSSCDGARFSVYIDVDMRAYPCSFMKHDKNDGVDIRGKTWNEVWNSNEFVSFRNKIVSSCQDCTVKKLCNGGCHGISNLTLCKERTYSS